MKNTLFLLLLFVSATCFSQQKAEAKKIAPQNTVLKTSSPATLLKTQSTLGPATTYTFIGNGNWSDPNNWDGNGVPPATTAPYSMIVIANVKGGSCILDVPYAIQSGTNPTSIQILPGSNLVVPGNFSVR
jgi:hypothetical protein